MRKSRPSLGRNVVVSRGSKHHVSRVSKHQRCVSLGSAPNNNKKNDKHQRLNNNKKNEKHQNSNWVAWASLQIHIHECIQQPTLVYLHPSALPVTAALEPDSPVMNDTDDA